MLKELAYYDGKWGAPEEVQIPFFDRSHFFGDGVYEATPGVNGKIFLLEDHLDRFYSSANGLEIQIPMEKKELGELLKKLLAEVEGSSHSVYWQVTRGVEDGRNHAYGGGMPGKLWVWIKQKKLRSPFIPIRAVTMEDLRFQYCNIKTLNLIPSVLAAQEAKKAGAYETIFHRGEVVTECAHSNVSILKNGVFISHPNDNRILRGIAKTHMIQACYRLGIPVMERPFTLGELFDADEILITSSSSFCLHADQIDQKPVGGKDPETLKKIKDAVIAEFLEYVGLEDMNDAI